MKAAFIFIVIFFLGILHGEVSSHPLELASLGGEHMRVGPQQTRPKTNQVKTKKADIKVVPKSRRQVKPTVVKSKMKVKPVKINRPKIKRP